MCQYSVSPVESVRALSHLQAIKNQYATFQPIVDYGFDSAHHLRAGTTGELLSRNVCEAGSNSHIDIQLTIMICSSRSHHDRIPRPINHPNQDYIIVGVPNTQIHVAITTGIQLTAVVVSNLLLSAMGNIVNRILQTGDGNLEHGMFNQVGANAVSVQVWNANNHQTTYGVLGGVLGALHEWMVDHQFTAASFGIFDGANQVGNGVINGAG